MSVPSGSILKLVVEAVIDPDTVVQNVYYFLTQTLAPEADATIMLFLEQYVEDAYNNILGYIVDDVTFNPITVDIIEFIDGKWTVTEHVGTEDVDLTTTNSADPFPNPVSAFATFNTARPKSKGRKFLFGFDENTANGSYVVAAVVTAIAAYAADVMATITLAPLNYVIPGIVRKGFDVFLEFESAVVTNVLGTQRRRRPGVGI